MATSIDELSVQISANASEANRQIGKLVSGLKHLQDALISLDVGNMSAVTSALNGVSQSLSNIADNEAADVLSNVGRELSTVAKSTDGVHDVSQAMSELSNATKNVSGELAKATGEISSASQKSEEIGMIASEFSKLNKPLKDSQNEAGKLKTILANFKIIVPTDKLDSVQKKMKLVQKEYDSLRSKMNEYINGSNQGAMSNESYNADKTKLEGLRNEYDKLMQKQIDLARSGNYRINTAPIEAMKKAFDGVINAGKKVSGVFATVGSAIKNAFSTSIGKVKDLAQQMLHIGSNSRSASKGLLSVNLSANKLVKSIARIGKMLKLMVTRKILQAIIKNAIQGFQNMVQYSSKFNESVSLLWNSFHQLGNSIGAAVAPLLNTFAPAINKVIQLIIEAINWVNQLFSALSGSSTWTKAKVLSEDYAESLENTGKSAKKLNKQLQGFDALNNLTTKDDDGVNPADMFEDVEVDNSIKDFADKIKDAWDSLLEPLKKAWSRVGNFIVDSLKGTWDKLKRLFKAIADSFMEVWNEERTVQMLEKILLIFGRIIRIVGILADKIREAWEYNNNGTRFLRAIRDILYVIVSWILKAVEYTQSWVNHLDFKPLFSNITEWTESLVRVVDNVMGVMYDFYITVLLPLAKWTLEKGLPQFFDIMKKFNEKVKWEKIREHLRNLFKALEPLGEKIGQGLLDFLGYLSNVLADILNSNLLATIIDSIAKFADFLANLDWNIDLSNLEESFIGFLESFSPLVEGVEQALEYLIENALKPIAEWTLNEGLPGLYNILTDINNSGLMQGIADGLNLILQAIVESVKWIGTTLVAAWEKLKPILDKFATEVLPKVKKTFQDLWEKVLVPLGEFLVTVFSPILSTIKDIFKALWNNVLKPLAIFIGGAFKDAFVVWIEFIDNKAIPKINSMIETLKIVWEKVLIPIGNFLKETLTPIFADAFDEICEHVENAKLMFEGLIKFLSGVFTDDWTKAWEGLKDIFGSIINEVIDIAEHMINMIIEAINTFFTGIRSAVNFIADKMDVDVSIGTIPKVTLPRYATGGFPENGLFMANSSEMVGRFSNGKTAVANNEQIVEGIAKGVSDANSEQNNLLRQQNALLQAILEKETGISSDDLFRSVQNSANNYYNRTGRYAFS